MVQFQGMTLDEYKNNCMSFKLLYGFHRTPYGTCLIAITEADEVVYLKFVDKDNESALENLMVMWPLTNRVEDTENKTNDIVKKIFYNPDGFQIYTVRILMKGTEFQRKVWEALTKIPRGTVITYEEVAKMIGNPKAAVAVGSAISKNYIACAVPCHRVKSKNGKSMYAWGVERKESILEYEKQYYAN